MSASIRSQLHLHQCLKLARPCCTKSRATPPPTPTPHSQRVDAWPVLVKHNTGAKSSRCPQQFSSALNAVSCAHVLQVCPLLSQRQIIMRVADDENLGQLLYVGSFSRASPDAEVGAGITISITNTSRAHCRGTLRAPVSTSTHQAPHKYDHSPGGERN